MPWLSQILGTPQSSPLSQGPITEVASGHLPEIWRGWLVGFISHVAAHLSSPSSGNSVIPSVSYLYNSKCPILPSAIGHWHLY